MKTAQKWSWIMGEKWTGGQIAAIIVICFWLQHFDSLIGWWKNERNFRSKRRFLRINYKISVKCDFCLARQSHKSSITIIFNYQQSSNDFWKPFQKVTHIFLLKINAYQLCKSALLPSYIHFNMKYSSKLLSSF